MKPIRSYHWWITGSLFAVAGALYLTGFTTGANATVVLAIIVEMVAWISYAAHPSNRSDSNSKE
ncbi:hypothetical protein [Usitatibacter palustris]|uniref:Uncharacterized protein n=1 Tax=Usitatibacter palustris TaxID=2732487 RepID=A0A6M4H2D1_9PROT|nr:hypothetical protein [Usitatibacter palustris]QJR13492.1 hypothetical protein DSM104440_00276 [Usitatibacter palustris]